MLSGKLRIEVAITSTSRIKITYVAFFLYNLKEFFGSSALKDAALISAMNMTKH